MTTGVLAIVLLSVGGSTVLGVLCGLVFRKIPHRHNDVFLGFAAGVMLAAAILCLLAPAFDTTSGVWLPILGTFTGAAMMSLLDRTVPHLHRLAGIENPNGEGGTAGKALMFVAAIALHKIPEGLATGVTFCSGDTGSVLTVAASMALQNIPESVVIVAPLLMAGVAVSRTVALSLAIAATSVVATLGGVVLSTVALAAAPFLLASAGGAMFYVISDEMIPETHSHGYEKPATFALIAGFLLVVVVQKLLSGVSFLV